jgi:hypothetical protein
LLIMPVLPPVLHRAGRLSPRVRAGVLLPLLTVGVLATSGCSVLTAVSMSPKLVAAPTPSQSPSVRVIRKPGALDTGSAERVLDAAGMHLILDYWTTDKATAWTPSSQGQVQLSAKVTGLKDRRVVKVTRVAVVAPPTSPHGSNVVVLDDRGQFVVRAPYTYQTAFALPVYPASTPGVTLNVTVDLLVETSPGSSVYTRLTQQDRLYLSTTPLTRATQATPAPTPTSGTSASS